MKVKRSFYGKDWRGSKWIAYGRRGTIIPELSGCYAIYADGELVYVGQAVNVRSRLNGHYWLYTHALAGKKITFKVRFSDRLGDWAMRELRLLKRLRPSQNVVFGSLPSRRTRWGGRF